MGLPPLEYDYRHASIFGSEIGPRREVTLSVTLLAPHTQADPNVVVLMRFGAIKNFDEVCAFCSKIGGDGLELASLRYAGTPPSKPGNLYFELIAERSDDRLLLHCGSVQEAAFSHS